MVIASSGCKYVVLCLLLLLLCSFLKIHKNTTGQRQWPLQPDDSVLEHWTGEPHTQPPRLPLLHEDPPRHRPRRGVQKTKHVFLMLSKLRL